MPEFRRFVTEISFPPHLCGRGEIMRSIMTTQVHSILRALFEEDTRASPDCD